MNRIKTTIFLLSLTFSLSCSVAQEDKNYYHYNKVYNYEMDTSVSKSFHADSLCQFSKTLLGSRYRSSGRSPKGFDCSGFAFYCFKNYGILLPYSAREQAKLGKEISQQEAKAGDLIFFQGYDIKDKSVHHVGILVNKKGEKLKFIHASSKGIQYDNMDSPYYKTRYIRIKRVY